MSKKEERKRKSASWEGQAFFSVSRIYREIHALLIVGPSCYLHNRNSLTTLFIPYRNQSKFSLSTQDMIFIMFLLWAGHIVRAETKVQVL